MTASFSFLLGLSDFSQSGALPRATLFGLKIVLVRVVDKQLTSHLQNNGLFQEFHSGFRVQRSTETELVKVLNDLFMAFDSELISVLVLSDLSLIAIF